MKRQAAPVLFVAALVVAIGGYAFHMRQQVSLAASFDEDTDEMASGSSNSAAAAAALPGRALGYQVSSSTPQFVLLSFDGSKSVPMLDETLDFERSMQAAGKPIRFTYFINAAYFITPEHAQLYQAPGQKKGVSNIGFAATPADIAARVKEFNTAFAAGNEIGSHSAGHFNGSHWSYQDWLQEFNSFTSLMAGVQQNNAPQAIDQPAFLSNIVGFRAPDLGLDDSLYHVLSDLHFAYDSSGINSTDAWPHKDAYGIWRIPLGTIFVGPHKTAMVAMDYNLWKHQPVGVAKGSAGWTNDFNEVEAAYTAYFAQNYYGNRAPVVIGDHFSKWNDGVYWEALKAFAENVCGQPQVRCVTFKELVDYLNTNGVPPLKS